jgi:predicted small integral membrane protein
MEKQDVKPSRVLNYFLLLIGPALITVLLVRLGVAVFYLRIAAVAALTIGTVLILMNRKASKSAQNLADILWLLGFILGFVEFSGGYVSIAVFVFAAFLSRGLADEYVRRRTAPPAKN